LYEYLVAQWPYLTILASGLLAMLASVLALRAIQELCLECEMLAAKEPDLRAFDPNAARRRRLTLVRVLLRGLAGVGGWLMLAAMVSLPSLPGQI
jgi:hypothetical protein